MDPRTDPSSFLEAIGPLLEGVEIVGVRNHVHGFDLLELFDLIQEVIELGPAGDR